MTSSNDNKDSSLPHAASRLVLYTNLKGKKRQKSNRQRQEESSGAKEEEERNKEEGEF